MFVVWLGALVTAALTVYPSLFGPSSASAVYNGVATVILLVTVWFANVAEALAEGRGKAKAASLRRTKTELMARARPALRGDRAGAGDGSAQGRYVRPRGHDGAHRAVFEVKNTLDHVALDGMDHPQSGAICDEVVNVVLAQGALEDAGAYATGGGGRLVEALRSQITGAAVLATDASGRATRTAIDSGLFKAMSLGAQLPDDKCDVSHPDRHDNN